MLRTRLSLVCRLCFGAALLGVAFQSVSAQATGSLLPVTRSDAEVLIRTLRDGHPKLKTIAMRARFDSAASGLPDRIAALPRAQAIMEMARLIAVLADGHTQLGLWWDASVGFARYPIRVYLFDDGIFVTQSSAAARILLGKRVLRIGAVPIEEVVRRMRPYLHGDNDMTRRDIIETRLVLHEVLETVGAAASGGTTFVVEDSAGHADSLSLSPHGAETPDTLINAQLPGVAVPLYLSHRESTYWFTTVPGTRTIYAQINGMQNDSIFTFAAFCDSLFRTLASTASERLILDLRFNNGGDNTLDDQFVHRMIRATQIDRPERFFVITGRNTFSAAVNLTAELRRHSAAILAGEPTGAPANHFGETVRKILPDSKIMLLYSTQYWQSGDPRDTSSAIVPTIATPFRFSDYRFRRDPALAAILARPVPSGSRSR